ncbi:HAD-IIIA family hydrolase [Halobacillus campisalis]|uniref:D,D-heptose 1,7-bisphosphate phosphatase n=1 Tax=Halobacillus campisalis TaxID=435909 RepID=A0ABW2K419_9BACI|nr:HAD-IIIA family hydrolase [Halobacillus campisalis]
MKALFLDRDGTLGGSDEIKYPGEFELYSGVPSSIRRLKQQGVLLFSFTNQPGISKGLSTLEDFGEELRGFGLDDVYVCPHSPAAACTCRKPRTGMIEQACEKYNLSPGECVVIGDRVKDMEAAYTAGCLAILVLTGSGEDSYAYLLKNGGSPVDYVAEDVNHAVNWLLSFK